MPFLSKLAPWHSTASLASAAAFKKLQDDSAIVGPIPSDVHTRREWVAAAQFAVNSIPFLLSDVQQLLPNERKTLAAMYGINDNNRPVATVCAEIVDKINASYGGAPSAPNSFLQCVQAYDATLAGKVASMNKAECTRVLAASPFAG